MRLAVFSDIHANYEAFRTCLSYADHVGADGYVFLGDYLTDCPYPERTLELLREASAKKPSWMIRGNREDDLIARFEGAQDGGNALQAAQQRYALEHLTGEDIAFLRKMPASTVLDFPGCPLLSVTHASPRSSMALIYPGTPALENVLRASQGQTMLAGHSHFQFRYESGGRQFINPGSVGMSFHGQPKAQFAFVSCLGGRWSARLMNVDYDKEAEIRQFKESGLFDLAPIASLCAIRTIRTGGTWAYDVFALARQLAPAEQEPSEFSLAQAARELGVLA